MADLRDAAAEGVVTRWHELRGHQTIYHSEWETIATLLMRNRKAFSSGGQPGEWQHRGVFNSTPVIAANNLAAGLYGTLTNPANKWLSLATPDQDLNDWKAARAWFDIATNITLASLRPGVSNFYEAVMPLYADIVSFGTSVQYDEAREAEGRILDKTLPLSEVAIAIGDDGELTEMIRHFRMGLRDAARAYGDALPATILDKAEKQGAGTVAFWHAVAKNDRYAPGGLGPQGKPFLSRTVVEEGPSTVRLSGYEEMPAYAPRWDVDAQETWGRGVGYAALPGVRMLNLGTEANIRGAQAHVDPITLTPDQRQLRREFRIHPGATLHGGMSMSGRPLVAQLSGPQGLPFGIDMVTRMEDQVKEMFGFSLMTVTNRSGMTPTEFLERQADRLRMMAPFLGRIQVEYLTRKIQRRFKMLWRAGQIPPPPPELAGAPLDVRYVSAAALAAKSTEGAATAQLIANLAPLMQVDPRYARRLDPDGVTETLAEAVGAPAKALRSREAADAIEQAAEQAAQMAQMAQLAPGLARAAKDAGMVEAAA